MGSTRTREELQQLSEVVLKGKIIDALEGYLWFEELVAGSGDNLLAACQIVHQFLHEALPGSLPARNFFGTRPENIAFLTALKSSSVQQLLAKAKVEVTSGSDFHGRPTSSVGLKTH